MQLTSPITPKFGLDLKKLFSASKNDNVHFPFSLSKSDAEQVKRETEIGKTQANEFIADAISTQIHINEAFRQGKDAVLVLKNADVYTSFKKASLDQQVGSSETICLPHIDRYIAKNKI